MSGDDWWSRNGPEAASTSKQKTSEGRFLGLTSNDWSEIGFVFDGVAFTGNAVYAAMTDGGFLVADALGHPEVGFAWYNASVLMYKETSVIPNVISTAGWGCTVASGFASGENSASYDGKRLSVSVSQDTAYATPFMAAGWLITEPNVGTVADGLVVGYDLVRLYNVLPTYINPTFAIEQHQNGGFSISFNWKRP